MTASANSVPEAGPSPDAPGRPARRTCGRPPPCPTPARARRPRAKRAPLETGATSPAVELRVTRTRWLAPSMRLASQGVVLSAGPISVSVGLTGR